MTIQAKALVAGMVAALLGVVASVTPQGAAIEEDIGLAWLFHLRGARPAPSEVVVITTDQESAFDLGVPQEPWKWRRSFHGRLVERLAEMGATVIAFDLFFKEPSASQEDRAFAQSLRRAGNVILFEKLATPGPASNAPGVILHVKPARVLAEAALGTAPNPLPAVPFRVNQFWVFDPASPSAPTLPFFAFQIHTLPEHERLLALMRREAPEISEALPVSVAALAEQGGASALVRVLRGGFDRHPGLRDELLTALDHGDGAGRDSRPLRSLVKAYSGPESRYLDFYGPPRTITTVPYSCVFDRCARPPAEAVDVAGRAVFVGLSEQIQSEQMDRFHTVFTSEDGIYLSGVEIMATAFANLLEDRQVTPLSMKSRLVLIALWGVVIGVVLGGVPRKPWLSTTVRIGLAYTLVSLALSAGYLGSAVMVFARGGVWVPLVVPAMQVGVGLFGTLVWRYREEQRDRAMLRQLFGRHLSEAVAEAIWQQRHRLLGGGRLSPQKLTATILFADLRGYTAAAEKLDPQTLMDWVGGYLERVGQAVSRHGGVVDDYTGDGLKADFGVPFPRTSQGEVRQDAINAVRCAVAMREILDELNRRWERQGLPMVGMRIGIATGSVIAGSIGSEERLQYTTIGDTVNVAARLESLDRELPRLPGELACRILIDEGTLSYVQDGFVTECVGGVTVKGRIQPVTAYRVLGSHPPIARGDGEASAATDQETAQKAG